MQLSLSNSPTFEGDQEECQDSLGDAAMADKVGSVGLDCAPCCLGPS